MTANPTATLIPAPHPCTIGSRPLSSTDSETIDRLIRVQPWIDTVVDRRGFDPRDPYVDAYWLGIIGPTATWIMRRFAEAFDHCPEGFALGVDPLAASIGVSAAKGAASPFDRAVGRCLRFGLARPNRATSAKRSDDLVLDVRRRLPQIPARSLRRLPEHLIGAHDDWIREHHRQGRPDDRTDRGPAPVLVSAGSR
jgi:hypothetical protein